MKLASGLKNHLLSENFGDVGTWRTDHSGLNDCVSPNLYVAFCVVVAGGRAPRTGWEPHQRKARAVWTQQEARKQALTRGPTFRHPDLGLPGSGAVGSAVCGGG